MPNKSKTPTKGYGKRPTWQWVLLYIIIGGLIYLLFYMLFFGGDGNRY